MTRGYVRQTTPLLALRSQAVRTIHDPVSFRTMGAVIVQLFAHFPDFRLYIVLAWDEGAW